MTVQLAQDLDADRLDWAVAMMQGYIEDRDSWLYRADVARIASGPYHPSSDAAVGQPILDRMGIATRRHSDGTWYAIPSEVLGDAMGARWVEAVAGERTGPLSYQVQLHRVRFTGPTMLVAGLRCAVGTTLGERIDVPDGAASERAA